MVYSKSEDSCRQKKRPIQVGSACIVKIKNDIMDKCLYISKQVLTTNRTGTYIHILSKAWNNLAFEIKQAPSLPVFKQRLLIDKISN